MTTNRLGLAAATLAAAALLSAPAFAGDLYGGRGSVKDGPALMGSVVGPCYVRGDIGYSWSGDPSAKFTQTTGGVFATDGVSNVSLDNTWLVGAGVGCGSGPRGIRGELMLDYRGDRDLGGRFAAPLGGTASTSVQTTTFMFNGYYDLGKWSNVVPYVGAGVGFAHNRLEEVSFSGTTPTYYNRLESDDKWALAWSLMAGLGWQVSERVIVDVGYRYIDMGKAESSRIDTGGGVNPAFRVDDLVAHEFKIGLRYHFGG